MKAFLTKQSEKWNGDGSEIALSLESGTRPQPQPQGHPSGRAYFWGQDAWVQSSTLIVPSSTMLDKLLCLFASLSFCMKKMQIRSHKTLLVIVSYFF